jgi:hypothetical protein
MSGESAVAEELRTAVEHNPGGSAGDRFGLDVLCSR